MQATDLTRPLLIGRSSSHFTRVARVVAAEMGVEYSFEIVPDLLSADAASYGGNPALRLPVLRTERGTWFGAQNICRELARRSPSSFHMIWPEDLQGPLLANAQELILQSMSTEVTLIMLSLNGSSEDTEYGAKQRTSLMNMLEWLDEHVDQILSALPQRDLSFLEVTLFCLFTHLEFREVIPVSPYAQLGKFSAAFGRRASAIDTLYRFDHPR